MPFDQRSLIHGEAWFPPCFARQNQQQKKNNFYCAAILDNFQTKNSNLRPLLSVTFHQASRLPQNFLNKIEHIHFDFVKKETFQRIGPLGRFFLLVEMSVYVSFCLSITLSHSVKRSFCPHFLKFNVQTF